MWRPEGEQGCEAGKIRWELVPYMRGECLDLGCGPYKVFPHFTGVDNCKDTFLFGIQMRPDVKRDVTKLGNFSSGFYDCVFSSHTLEHIDDYVGALKEWWSKVKLGGYLILYLPHKDLYPQCEGKEEWVKWFAENGEQFPNVPAALEFFVNKRREKGITKIGELYRGTPNCNPDHKHDFDGDDIIKAMKKIGGNFDLLVNEVRDQGDEYSFFQVYQRISSGVRESWKEPKPAKTCAVVRYGAIGDMVQTSSIFPWLKEQGYHVTLYCQSGDGLEAVKHDPHIDRLIVQERDAVPPQFLSEFWGYTRRKYTKWVNLSESVEGTLLACPDRVQYEWPNHLRAKYLDRNYMEWVHELAEVPPPFRQRFYATKSEQEWAKEQARKFGKRNVLWSLSGSSGHKMWPHLDSAIAAMLLHYPDVHIVLVGDESCQILEQGWVERDGNGKVTKANPRVHCMSGAWSIRQSLAFSEVADLVIGTETGLLNAVGMMDVPKIITLSHSSENMLTKHWKNAIALKQPEGVGCPKSPCRQLHGSGGFDQWMDCPRHEESGAALCQFHVTPEMMWKAIQSVLNNNESFTSKSAVFQLRAA